MSEQQNICRISSNSYEYGHNLWNSVGIFILLGVAVKYVIFPESTSTTIYEFGYVGAYLGLDILWLVFYPSSSQCFHRITFIINRLILLSLLYVLHFDLTNVDESWALSHIAMIFLAQATVWLHSVQSNFERLQCCETNWVLIIVWVITRFGLHSYLLVIGCLKMFDSDNPSSLNKIDLNYAPFNGALLLLISLSIVWSCQHFITYKKSKTAESKHGEQVGSHRPSVVSEMTAANLVKITSNETDTNKSNGGGGAVGDNNNSNNNGGDGDSDKAAGLALATSPVSHDSGSGSGPNHSASPFVGGTSLHEIDSNDIIYTHERRRSSKVIIEFDKQWDSWQQSKHLTMRQIFFNKCKEYPYDSYKYQKYIKSYFTTNEELISEKIDSSLWKSSTEENSDLIDKIAFFAMLKEDLLLPIPQTVDELQKQFSGRDIDMEFMRDEINKQEATLWNFFIFTPEELTQSKEEYEIRTYMTYDDFSSGLSGLITATVDWTSDAHKCASNALFEIIDHDRDGYVECPDVASLLLSLHKMYAAVFNYQTDRNLTKGSLQYKSKKLIAADWGVKNERNQPPSTLNKLQFAHMFGELGEKHLKDLEIDSALPHATELVYDI